MRRLVSCLWHAGILFVLNASIGQAAESSAEAVARLDRGQFRWSLDAPLVSPAERPSDRCYSIKDPTIVRFEDRWHLFCTIRSEKRTHQIEYLNFRDWPNANKAERHVLALSDNYFCAPQVFYFTPHKRWYLIYQVVDNSRKPALQPAYSTSTEIAVPASWTAPRLLFDNQPANVSAWIDFWIICDGTKAHLFFTSNNGLLWRAETRLGDFPGGWTVPGVVLRDDIFEASHTYRLKDCNEYLTIVEAQGDGGRRYYKAYLAERLDGEWRPVAATPEKPFASAGNVHSRRESWTDSFSHGELIRTGYDEKLEVDPGNLQFLFQGVSDAARAGKSYGDIPWQLGLLEPER